MSIRKWKQRYKSLRIRYLKLEAKYYRLKAKMLAGEPLKVPDFVSKERYLKTLAMLKTCRVKLLELKEKMAEI